MVLLLTRAEVSMVLLLTRAEVSMVLLLTRAEVSMVLLLANASSCCECSLPMQPTVCCVHIGMSRCSQWA